ncbi:small-conductance mechanosensitive channel [hydrocarbon metagenome]|uniref:Small-conductance mechanosensitive channel n=1 Tax=hydrocarbon metagenome TaxID=938273 RepID=A0A0W8G0Q0_9ZZZZ
MKFFEDIQNWLNQYPFIKENIALLGVLLLSYIIYLVTKKVLLRVVKSFVQRTKNEWDDILLSNKMLKRISLIAPFLVIINFSYLVPTFAGFIERFSAVLIIFFIILTLSALLNGVVEIYEKIEKYKERPIKGYLQVVKIIMYIFGGILIITALTGQSPWAILGGLGALTAVIILVFRDTILSFVASIQISSYDLIKVGDWIEVPKFGADGDVIDIALHTIKVQNWDKTITVIPTYKLIEDSFKNWRGMQLSGGRRIKRSIYIDQNSITFCNDEMLERFGKFQLIKSYLEKKKTEIAKFNEEKKIDTSQLINGRRLTNVGTFRAYLREYLLHREDVHKGLTFLVRHLPPGPEGLPIEIYVFATTTKWGEYEDIQSDIFDHIFAVVPQFDLRIFQNPTGNDFKSLANNKN